LRTFVKISYVVLAFVLIAGCADISHVPESFSVGIDGKACVGTVIDPPAGLTEISDTELFQSALGGSEQGKLCTGKVFIVETPVTVYRVWDSSKSYTAFGRWWSLFYPEGSRDNYRKANVICPEWSALDRMSVCFLKIGARVVIGPGQSAKCSDSKVYPQSPVNQVYVPNDSRSNQIFVDNCTEAEWQPQ
jgi:hypothetical protein